MGLFDGLTWNPHAKAYFDEAGNEVELKGLRYELILDCNAAPDCSIVCSQPRRSVLAKLKCTEGDECADLDGEKHRKYVGTLTQKQFDALIDDCDLTAEDVETLGALGGLGLAPAVSFTGGGDVCYVAAYVTPLPPGTDAGVDLDDEDWLALRRYVIARYG